MQGARSLTGAFAFASSRGVTLLTQDAAFQAIAQNNPVDLVVGVDSITNERALDRLAAVSDEHPNVQVRAFLNPKPGSIFHPKFVWTTNPNGGHLITGSGNLTEGGLLGNWEAYSIEQLDIGGVASVEAVWDAWSQMHEGCLLPLDNAQVRARARANNPVLAPEGDLPTLDARAAGSPAAPTPVSIQSIAPTADVLIAEIPQSGNRWNQVNFHADDFRNFFGARVGENRMMMFRSVNEDGILSEYERNRPPVTVRSRNFRIELAAAAGLTYPQNGRPIGVYIRTATRTFFYRILLPGDTGYAEASGLLTTHAGAPPVNRMRSIRITADELRRGWPDAPFWDLTADS